MADAPEGVRYLPGHLGPAAQTELLRELGALVAAAPLYRPVMPNSGRPFSVRMTNAGSHGWFADRGGYRYVARHPETGRPWPPIPAALLALWREAAGGYPGDPECCLVNYYAPEARRGLHRDADEETFAAPVVSLSLGDSAVFRIGGPERRGPTTSLKLHSGDVVVLAGAAGTKVAAIGRWAVWAGSWTGAFIWSCCSRMSATSCRSARSSRHSTADRMTEPTTSAHEIVSDARIEPPWPFRCKAIKHSLR
jgi:alkylated DNA repair protein (DNA oxidative demethylase)